MGHSERGIVPGGIDHSVQAGRRSMGNRFCKEAKMSGRRIVKLVHEGSYVAEVDVATIFTEDGWAPYRSVEDAYKLDDVRDALRRGDLKAATKIAKVYSLTPVAA
jgi:hypothetical protein